MPNIISASPTQAQARNSPPEEKGYRARPRPLILIYVPKPSAPPLDVVEILRPRVEKLDVRRAFNRRRAAVLESQGAYTLSRSLEACGEVVEFCIWNDGDGHVQSTISGGLFCQQPRLCRICAARRTGRLVETYWGRVLQCLLDDKGLFPVTCALTAKSAPTIDASLRRLSEGVTRFLERRRRALGGHRHHSELTKAAGGVFSFEVKRGSRSHEWHVHAHGILLLRERLDAGAFTREWASCIGQAHANTFLHALRGADNVSSLHKIQDDFLEVFKYNVKLGDVDDVEALDVFRAVQGKRLLRPFGVLKGVHLQTDNEPAPREGPNFVVVDQGGRYLIEPWPSTA